MGGSKFKSHLEPIEKKKEKKKKKNYQNKKLNSILGQVSRYREKEREVSLSFSP